MNLNFFSRDIFLRRVVIQQISRKNENHIHSFFKMKPKRWFFEKQNSKTREDEVRANKNING